MADDDKRQEANRNFDRGEAANTVLSLSQALLAPLDAILKAQVHAARSFLNFILQIGFPPRSPASPPAPGGPEGGGQGGENGGEPPVAAQRDQDRPHQVQFCFDSPGGGRHRISIPALALVPVAPLGVSGAKFQFDFFIREIARHRQIQASRKSEVEADKARSPDDPDLKVDRNTRPWFLVDTPLSLQGTFAPSAGKGEEAARATEARFHVDVTIAALPMPAALEKMLAGLSQAATTIDDPPPPRNDRPAA